MIWHGNPYIFTICILKQPIMYGLFPNSTGTWFLFWHRLEILVSYNFFFILLFPRYIQSFVRTYSWLAGFLSGSLKKVLLFQNLASGMRITLHQLMVLLIFLTKCGRRGRVGEEGHQGLMRHLTPTRGGKMLKTVLRLLSLINSCFL